MKTYVVKKGDSLWKIHKMTGTPMKDLIRQVPGNPDLIHPGLKLSVRGQQQMGGIPAYPDPDIPTRGWINPNENTKSFMSSYVDGLRGIASGAAEKILPALPVSHGIGMAPRAGRYLAQRGSQLAGQARRGIRGLWDDATGATERGYRETIERGWDNAADALRRAAADLEGYPALLPRQQAVANQVQRMEASSIRPHPSRMLDPQATAIRRGGSEYAGQSRRDPQVDFNSLPKDMTLQQLYRRYPNR